VPAGLAARPTTSMTSSTAVSACSIISNSGNRHCPCWARNRANFSVSFASAIWYVYPDLIGWLLSAADRLIPVGTSES